MQKIPEATVRRLSVYSRYVDNLEKNGVLTVSSAEIAEGVKGSPAQVRKDLAYFGEFGVRGVGYNVASLNQQIIKILGLSSRWKVIIVGAGNLGSALAQYKGFRGRGFDILAVFDNDLNKVGLQIGGVPIYPITKLEEYVRKENVHIGIVAVPYQAAQEVVDKLVNSGIQAILNFTTAASRTPSHVEIRNVDLAVDLEILTFNIGANNK